MILYYRYNIKYTIKYTPIYLFLNSYLIQFWQFLDNTQMHKANQLKIEINNKWKAYKYRIKVV